MEVALYQMVEQTDLFTQRLVILSKSRQPGYLGKNDSVPSEIEVIGTTSLSLL